MSVKKLHVHNPPASQSSIDQKLPLISIITVCLNSSRTIRLAIESVLRQNYSHIEYIVIDGGSTDGTLDIIREYESHIDVTISEPDRGIADAFNKGARLAHGELIGYMNADDVYLDGALSWMVQQYLGDGRSADILYGDAICQTRGGAQFVVVALPLENISTLTPFICHQSMLARRDLFERVGHFNTDLRFGMDFDWILRCLSVGACLRAHSGVPLVRYSADGYSGQNALKALFEFRHIALANSKGFMQVNAYYTWKITKALLQEFLYAVGLKRFVLSAKVHVKRKYRSV